MTDPSRWRTNEMPTSSPNSTQSQPRPYNCIQNNDNRDRQSYSPLPLQTTPPVTILPKPPAPTAATGAPHKKVLQPNPYPPIAYSTYPYQNDNSNGSIKAQGKPENQRSRTIRACDVCRRKKIKCNTNGPGSACNYCKSINIECTFTDSGKKRGPARGYTETLEGRLKRMEKMLTNILDQPQPSDDIPTKKRKLAHTQMDISSATVHRKTEDIVVYKVDPEDQTVKDEDKDLNDTFDMSSISTELRTRFMGDRNPLQFLAGKLNVKPNFIAHVFGTRVKQVGETLVYKRDDDTDKNANQRFLEGIGMLKPGESIKGINSWIYKISGLDKSTSDSLMKVYFAHVHPLLPVLNKQLFLRQYREEFNEYPSAPLLNAIYGAAVRYIEICKKFGDHIHLDNNVEMKDGQSEHFFECQIVYMKRRYSPCISAVQAILIGQNHKFGLDQKVGSKWLLSSIVIRMAQDLGLNRSCDSWNIPVSEKETRKRVWWSVYILDRWTAASTGRPQTIFDDDCDVEYPSESAGWEEVMDFSKDENSPRFPSAVGENTPTSGSLPIYQQFVELIKLSEILGYILQGLYTPLAKQHSEKHGSNAIVSYVDNALSKWRNELPEDLKFNKMNEKNAALLSKSGMLYASYCTLLILLHRPFIEKEGGPNTRSSQSSLSICTSAATRMIDITLKMHYRDCLLISWNFVLYPVFTAALIHINNAKSPDKTLADSAKSNLIKSSAFIKRIALTSPGAAQLHFVLDQLTKLRDITAGTGKVLESFATMHGYTKTRFVPESTTQVDAPHKRLTNDIQNRSASPKAVSDTPVVSEAPESSYNRVSTDGSESISNSNSSTRLEIDIAPPQPTDQEVSMQMLPLEVETYSLRQFGLSMDVPNTTNNELYNTDQDLNAYLNTDFAIPTHTFGFATSDTHAQTPFQNSYPLMDETLFRNRPDNAFWSVPSSMVLDDWLAYLLPQQSNIDPNDSNSWNQDWM